MQACISHDSKKQLLTSRCAAHSVDTDNHTVTQSLLIQLIFLTIMPNYSNLSRNILNYTWDVTSGDCILFAIIYFLKVNHL